MKLSDNPTDEESRLARINLVAKLIEYECDAQKLAEAGCFHVEAADFNAIRAQDIEALSFMAFRLDRQDDNFEWLQKAIAIREAIYDKMLKYGRAYQLAGRAYDLAGIDEQPIQEATAGEFVTLFGRLPSEEASHLIPRLGFAENWPNYPVPTSPTNAALFDGDRYWRGNVWLNVNWLIWYGLRRAGYIALARELTDRSLALVDKHGFHEYFNPITGKGHGSFPHSWSAIVLDMLLTELHEQIR